MQLLSFWLFHLTYLTLTLTLTLANTLNGTGPIVPAVFAFGDSILDTGNNNFLTTFAKSNFPPYGFSFPGHRPTGRFCDGKIASDFMASNLGVKELLPPYVGTNLSPEELLTGVSFASGGSGYDPLTPTITSALSLGHQLMLFKEYKEKIRSFVGDERAAKIVNESLYVLCAGSNDVSGTYQSMRKMAYDVQPYTNLMLNTASNFLEELVKLGARKIGVVGIPPIGCVPAQRTLVGGILRGCDPSQNQLAQLLNSKIKKELQILTTKYQGTTMVYLDIYEMLLDIIQHPYSYGFLVSTRGCCGTGNMEVAYLCNSLTTTICPDVSEYVFWDSYHPTEKVYEILVDMIYKNYIHLLI